MFAETFGIGFCRCIGERDELFSTNREILAGIPLKIVERRSSDPVRALEHEEIRFWPEETFQSMRRFPGEPFCRILPGLLEMRRGKMSNSHGKFEINPNEQFSRKQFAFTKPRKSIVYTSEQEFLACTRNLSVRSSNNHKAFV